MARLPRIRLPGYPFHVVIRGNDRGAIFGGDGDHLYFHRTLIQVSRRFGMRVHAYVFMPNHVHLLVTGDLPESISKCVQSLGRRYVAYFNFIHKRTGTLWEGRFFSSVVDTDGYFLACHRYIEMNPVRASLCRHPGEHVWSSYRYYAQVRPDELVTPHAVHASLGIPGPAHARLFETALKAETVDRIRDAVNHGWALGDEPFKAHLAEVAARRTERVKTGRPRKKPELSKLESDPSFS